MNPLMSLALVRLDGTPFPSSELSGKAVLFVNVASKCGLTPQYEGLQALWTANKDRGLVIVGVPSNQFGAQEPGTKEEIATFCKLNYGVTFPLLEKQDVNGSGRSALYQWLVASEAGGNKDITWNFEKFVVGRDGQVVARLSPKVTPDAPELKAAIDRAIAP
ncbi:MAG: glutathione peroxidase [Myxococcota bacterium]